MRSHVLAKQRMPLALLSFLRARQRNQPIPSVPALRAWLRLYLGQDVSAKLAAVESSARKSPVVVVINPQRLESLFRDLRYSAANDLLAFAQLHCSSFRKLKR